MDACASPRMHSQRLHCHAWPALCRVCAQMDRAAERSAAVAARRRMKLVPLDFISDWSRSGSNFGIPWRLFLFQFAVPFECPGQDGLKNELVMVTRLRKPSARIIFTQIAPKQTSHQQHIRDFRFRKTNSSFCLTGMCGRSDTAPGDVFS